MKNKPFAQHIMMSWTLLLVACGYSDTAKPTITTTDNLPKQAPLIKAGALPYDTSTIAILPFNTSHVYGMIKGEPTTLAPEDFIIIDSLFMSAVNDYNQRVKHASDKINNPYTYKRQYMAVVNSGGEKDVWINCFCHNFHTDWKKQVVAVDDGGKCFFNLVVHLGSKTYSHFGVNGNG